MSAPIVSVAKAGKGTEIDNNQLDWVNSSFLSEGAHVGSNAIATNSTQLRSMQVWDGVKIPPAKKLMMKGFLVPTIASGIDAVTGILQKKRRVTIEIRQPLDSDVESNNPLDISQLLKGSSSKDPFQQQQQLAEDDILMLRILEAKTKPGDGGEHSSPEGEAESTSTIQSVFWEEERRFDLSSIEVVKAFGRVCDLKIGTGNDTHILSLNFQNRTSAQSFFKIMEQAKLMVKARSKRQAQAFTSESGIQDISSKKIEDTTSLLSDPSKVLKQIEQLAQPLLGTKSSSFVSNQSYEKYPVDMIVEICSASNIPVGDFFASDPYVIVHLGGRQIHQTQSISNTLNPIWTLETGSHFLIRMTAAEFFSGSSFITFAVKDNDVLRKDDTLGTVNIKKDRFLKGKGQRIECVIDLALSNERKKGIKTALATLALRYRPASKEDVELLTMYESSKKYNRTGVLLEEAYVPPEPHDFDKSQPARRKVEGRFKTKAQESHLTTPSSQQYLVRPGPCPLREHETTWMTKEEIDAETLKPSLNWIESGTGTLGKVYIEILGMDGLPNLDTSIGGRDKTDSYTCVVVEDSIVNTCVVNGCLSPRFMPWTQRAFVFNIMYPTSEVHLGAFDYDPVSTLVTARHERIGKININLMNLVPKTDYVSQYDLYTSSAGERFANGSVTVRIRVEWRSERRALFAALSPPSPTFVGVQEKSDFKVVNYTIIGEEQPQRPSVQTVLSYLQELQAYEEILHHLGMAALTVFLWRGHYDINFRIPRLCSKRDESEPNTCMYRWTRRATIWLPLHSVTAFVWGLLLVYDLNLVPSFLAFCVGWAFLATMEFVRSHPSPWKRCRSYGQLFGVLLCSHSWGSRSIEYNKNLAAIEAYEHAEEERKRQKKIEQEEERSEQKRLEYQLTDIEKLAQDDEADIVSKDNNVASSVNPLNVLIGPIQDILKKVCVALRISKSIVLWRNPFVAFWIVTASFLVTIGFAFVPWGFLIRWAIKIVVMVLLGPWMKVLDWCYFRKRQHMTLAEKKNEMASNSGERYKSLAVQASRQKIRKENLLKLQSMTKFLFGKYIMRVPGTKEGRYWNDATPASAASRHDDGEIYVSQRKSGQRLIGEIIPKRPDFPKELRTPITYQPHDEREFLSMESQESQPLLQRCSTSSYASADTDA